MTNEQIRIAWNEAEEIHSSLNELTDEEVIECIVKATFEEIENE